MKAGNLTIKWLYIDNAITSCQLWNRDVFNGGGVAECTIHDNFCKETGRKLSLARAMKNANFPKEERKVIWEIYRNTKLGGRW
jgi:hypothetical protein